MQFRSLIDSAVTIERITLAWMIVESVASIYAGVAAHSTALVAFGADSVIELVTAVILLWRLVLERDAHEPHAAERAERIAAWTTTWALLALIIYIVALSVYSLMSKSRAERSPVGILVSIAAVAIMPYLASRKRTLAKALNSSALRADAACSATCGYLASALLVGLLINAITGWWWVDNAIALALLYWLIPETREAFEGARSGKLECGCHD